MARAPRAFNPYLRELKVIREYSKPAVNVIAVHGLAVADATRTWIDKSQSREWNWLTNQLVDVLPEARVWTFGYDSSWYGEKSVDSSLTDVAKRLLDDLKRLSANFFHIPLIFIAHSFGGIVVMKALDIAENNSNEWSTAGQPLGLFKHTDAVLFFGTPFRGIHDWFQTELPRLVQEKHPYVQREMLDSFRHNSDILKDLVENFMNRMHKYKKPNVGCFSEGQVSDVGKIVDDNTIKMIRLVTSESAQLGGPTEGEPRVISRPLERNHFNLHNFGKDDTLFNIVENVMYNILPNDLLGTLVKIAELGLTGRIQQLLLEKPFDIDFPNKDGWTPLMAACFNGHEDIVKLLLRAGADIEAQNNDLSTALYLAAMNGHHNIVYQLLDRNADIEHRNIHNGTALLQPSLRGHVRVVRALLAHGADVNVHNKDGFTPLSNAAINGHLDVVEVLLNQGQARINEYNKWGMTALCEACRHGHPTVVHALLDREASLHAQISGGPTPMGEAEFYHQDLIVRILEGASRK